MRRRVPLLPLMVLVACGDASDGVAPATAYANPDSAALNAGGAVSTRHVRFEALSEIQGQPWASMAEFDVLDSAGKPLPRTQWRVSASSHAADDGPLLAVDGNPNTIWHSAWKGTVTPPPHHFDVDLGAKRLITGFVYLPRQDLSRNGIVSRYKLYASDDGIDWGEPIAEGDLNNDGRTFAAKPVLFAAPTPNRPPVLAAVPRRESGFGEPSSFKLDARDPEGDPVSFRAEDLPPGIELSPETGTISGTPILAGRYKPTVAAYDAEGLAAKTSFNWLVHPPSPLPPTTGGDAAGVRFVKLEALSEIGGRAWASIAELNLIDEQGRNLPRAGWKASASSSDISDAPANVLDGDIKSIWHTRWTGNAPQPPHSLILDLGQSLRPHGVRILPRQDGIQNGMVAEFRLFFSADATDWGEPVLRADLSKLGTPAEEKSIPFECLPWSRPTGRPGSASACVHARERR